ncbi:hypothetical protein CF326_g7795, partial [Tilletia indica]
MPRRSAYTHAIEDLDSACIGQVNHALDQAAQMTELALLDNDLAPLALEGSSAAQKNAGDIIEVLSHAHSRRYLLPRAPVWRATETLWDRLQEYERSGDSGRFHSAVRMEPGAFRAIALMLKSRPEFSSTRGGPAAIELQLSVALYRLGHSISITEVAAIAGCSQGSVSGYTAKIVSALCDLESELIPWASEEEKREAKDWVSTRSGVPEFGQGFAMVDGVHIPL